MSELIAVVGNQKKEIAQARRKKMNQETRKRTQIIAKAIRKIKEVCWNQDISNNAKATMRSYTKSRQSLANAAHHIDPG